MIKKFLTALLVLCASGCTSKVLPGTWHNLNLDLIDITVVPDGEEKYLVTIKNLSSKPVMYIAPLGLSSLPTYYIVVDTPDGESKIMCNYGEVSHDYILAKNQEVSFSLAKTPGLLKVGFPIYNEQLDEYIIWFSSNQAPSKRFRWVS